MATLSQRLQAEIDRANATTSKTDTTVHNAIGSLIEGYGQGGKEQVEWHQCPEAPRNFINNVTYDPNDYSTSQIENYAPATAVKSNTKPIGKTIDGVTYYNEIPNVKTPFASANAAGTLKPLDQLRWLNTDVAPNVRDIGGWACDGGTVKYGMLVRGGMPSNYDTALSAFIRRELDLRSRSDGSTDAQTRTESVWGTSVYYYIADSYNWYSLVDQNGSTATWISNLQFLFDGVKHNEPVYFHCSAGADRTGTLACIIEALLGMSQSDIDKDYELTTFDTGTGTASEMRARNETDWKGLINQINAQYGVTFRDKVVNWVGSLGFTADDINSFRHSMIDGNPEDVTITTPTIIYQQSDIVGAYQWTTSGWSVSSHYSKSGDEVNISSGRNDANIVLNPNVPIANKSYTIRFDAKSNANDTGMLAFLNDSNQRGVEIGRPAYTTDYKTFTYTFTGNSNYPRLQLQGSNQGITFKNLQITENI